MPGAGARDYLELHGVLKYAGAAQPKLVEVG